MPIQWRSVTDSAVDRDRRYRRKGGLPVRRLRVRRLRVRGLRPRKRREERRSELRLDLNSLSVIETANLMLIAGIVIAAVLIITLWWLLLS